MGTALATASQPASDQEGAGQKVTGREVKAAAFGDGGLTSVTLLTGDRVYVDSKGAVARVEPGKGRSGIRISTYRIKGISYVIPSDALSMVAAGTLDRRLFDVAGLVKAQYDDARVSSVPLIVSYAKPATAGPKSKAQKDITAAGASRTRSLPVLNADAVSVPVSDATSAWKALTEATDAADKGGQQARKAAPGIARIDLDGKVTASLSRNVSQIGAPDAWKAGYDGTGVKVAVLDTGIDQTHPDLAGRVIAERNFTDSRDIIDRVGHGTHVASIIAGSGAKSGGEYRGVAPGARILDGKVLDDTGSGTQSDIIAGMEWAAEQGAKVVNLSLGGDNDAEEDPLERAVDQFSADKGVLFVVAAGNQGPGPRTIGSPGSAASALTVGAVDGQDQIAEFSSVGPTAEGRAKPDITAPGVSIVAARAANGYLGTPAADGYVSMSGTSMATPHVAGSAAILAQQHPKWNGEQLKQALTNSAEPTDGLSHAQQGFGRVDLTKGIKQTLTNTPGVVDFGTQQWPHGDDKPVTRTVTFTNDGASDVTLDVSVDSNAPQGMFTLGSPKVTVPAGGSAGVQVTADPRAGSLDGAFSGTVIAKAPDGQIMRTSVSVVREVESYDLTVRSLDAQGKPTSGAVTVFGVNTGTIGQLQNPDGNGNVTFRLPKDDYIVEDQITTGPGDSDGALVVRPKLTLGKSQTLTLDSRTAKPIRVTAPDKAKIGHASIDYAVTKPDGSPAFGTWLSGDSFAGIRVAQAGPQLPGKQFNAQISGVWSKGTTRYNLVYTRTKSMYTGFTHTASLRELTLVNAKVGLSAPKAKGAITASWTGYEGADGFAGAGGTMNLPVTSKQYISALPGLKWAFSFNQYNALNGEIQTGQSTDYRSYPAGRSSTVTFNVGPFTPTVGAPVRTGNLMQLCMPLYSNGAAMEGVSVVTSGQTVFRLNGEKFLEWPTACKAIDGLPSEQSTIRIDSHYVRAASVSGVSSEITAAWTFTTKKKDDDTPVTLPLSSLRFSPKLSMASTAKAGTKLTVPLTVEGSAAGANLKSLGVKVSYDNGATWRNAPVTTKDGKKYLRLSHPAKAKSVSFKATVVDKQGNTYALTVLKAYLLK
ncbi:S8 family serine peptidase [Streptomyces sp. GbtcB6]|uniref:S8 family serine peptidase n=1 Tax=Streptomyces sp. GbtcB6 TaxID=2824751 RepID=UPI001C30D2F0|nr:S8 family serine peptidase [Streptomyces sp. GbtcB6]